MCPPQRVVAGATYHALCADPRSDERLADEVGRASAYLPLPERFGIFYDWCSLCQKDEGGARTEAEQEAFSTALGKMQVWYAHQKLFAILLTELPLTDVPTTPYFERGWPTCEHAWTMLAKSNSYTCWPMVLEVSSHAPSGEARRVPPQHPDALAVTLEARRFTSPKADKPLVTQLYRATLGATLRHAEKLDWDDSGWDDADFEALAAVLPFCERCTTLYLSRNGCADAGAIALAAAFSSGALPALATLALNANLIGDAGTNALADALEREALPKLARLVYRKNAPADASAARLQRACAMRGVETDGDADGTWGRLKRVEL